MILYNFDSVCFLACMTIYLYKDPLSSVNWKTSSYLSNHAAIRPIRGLFGDISTQVFNSPSDRQILNTLIKSH